MSGMQPVAVYGLKVEANDVMVPAVADFPATVSSLWGTEFAMEALQYACTNCLLDNSLGLIFGRSI